MKPKLSDWASIAEIVSGIAVVVTLIFLILGIRENTDITRVSVYSDLIDSVNALERDFFKDPELFELWRNFTFGRLETLEDQADKERLQAMMVAVYRNYEKAFFARQYGEIGDDEWDRFDRLICDNYRNSLLIELDVSQHPALTQRFRQHIDSSCVSLDR